ncbi:phospholipase A2 inhibitor and Ly6/PLAUR domain-containing protein-like isoform X2 [Rana temporaria]|uniref:phospholipase A2 inhibitor and Ly6/PLAUR domain-containing protein-like isoform X2 n=1 Tax=Rana temporaria TaxID=8407 RepID=UPI001AAD1092|nr:phospholipase A2 inhibitor and Ly6/PLAUR domain-containing protein-like isoform X2 [Rana temporaria]
MKTLPSLILVIFISVTTEALICHFCEDLSGPNCKATKSETCPKDVKKCYTNLMMEKFVVTPKDLKENGVECPACNEKEKQCKSEIYKCTGTQDRCFEFYGGLYNGEGYDDWTFKGCTTKQVCDYLESHDGYEVHYTRKDSKIKCTKK